MKKCIDIPQSGIKRIIPLLLFILSVVSTNAYGARDTTVFRIKVLEDTVYAGDTIHVDFFIGNPEPELLGNLNILNAFEMEAVTDTSIIDQAKTHFSFDQSSLAHFFGTLFSNLTANATLNPIFGSLNMKVKSPKTGRGNARVGRGQYIVQDNAVGKQHMKFTFSKAISKGLLGFNNPVKVEIDSVVVMGKQNEGTPIITAPPVKSAMRTRPTEDVKVYPNPTSDYVYIEGAGLQGYRLLTADGRTILSDKIAASEMVTLDMNAMTAGFYFLLVQREDEWDSYKIVKN